jgi:hypothetical protein
MEMIADTGQLGSLDIMELNPSLDMRKRTAAVAVDLVASLFGKSTWMRRETPASGMKTMQPRRDLRECLINMPLLGLGKTAAVQPATTRKSSASGRLRSGAGCGRVVTKSASDGVSP